MRLEDERMRDMHCRDAGIDCDFVARGNTDQEILTLAGRHAKDVHGMTMSPDLEKKVRGLIHDESSDAHRRSMTSSSKSP
jgi:predicted small metal-binding protein